MRYDIYCDESHPDVFWSQSANKARYLCIGGLWLRNDLRAEVKNHIRDIRERHGLQGEIKWHKVHAYWEPLYHDLIELFAQYDAEAMRFRCIVVEGDKVEMARYHEDDAELGFYKFYYQLLKHWIEEGNEYRIFCDEKTNRKHNRLRELQYYLNSHLPCAKVFSVQALPSHEVQLIQFSDFLLGMASSRLNKSVVAGSVKDRVITYLEQRLGKRWGLVPTVKVVRKFNIFKIELQGVD